MWVASRSTRLGDLARGLGHAVDGADGPTDRAEIMLLDGADAWDVVRGWRAAGNRVPVVVLGLAEPPADRARLEPVVLLREATAQALGVALDAAGVGRPAGRVQLAGGVADLDRKRFEPTRGEPVSLSPLECRLLGYMAARSGRPISREELQLQVWDHRKAVATRAVDMSVMRLRKKIEPGAEPTNLLTARNGYRLLVLEEARTRPPSADALIGRDALLSDILGELQRGGSVLLTGPPGVGKSALARTAAARWSGPVVFADLDGIGTPERAAEALSEAAGADMVRGIAPGEALGAVMGAAPGTLWVADHLDDAPQLVRMLVDAADGPVLATSRRVGPGAAVREVPPLPAGAAAELLARRARRAGAEISAEALEDLVPLLDGLPLAIELAAANLRVLGTVAAEVLAEEGWLLPDDLGRSLAAAIERSWVRLEPQDQGLLAALSVVEGPVDLGLARRLWPGSGGRSWGRLVDASLVSRWGEDHVVLHAIRAFAADALPNAAASAERAHAGWMAAHAARWLVPATDGPEGDRALGELIRRRQDMDRAWAWALDRGEDGWLADLTEALDRLGWRFGTVRSRQFRIEAALERAREPLALARLWYRLGICRSHIDRPAAIEAFEQAATLAEGLDPDRAALAGRSAANILLWTGGATAALARLRAIDHRGCSERVQLEVRGSEVDLLDRIGEGSVSEVQDELLRISTSLAELGDMHGASWAGQCAGSRLVLTWDRDPIAHMQRITAWTRQVADPRMLAQALITFAAQLGGTCATERALSVLDEASEVIARIEPVRAWQIRSMRGRVLAQGGRSEGRSDLEAYLGWCREVDSPVGAADAALWLASLEIEADDPLRADHHGRSAAEDAEAAGYKNMVWHAAFARCQAMLELGRFEPGLEAIQTVPLERLTTPLEQLRCATLERVAARRTAAEPWDVDLERVAAAVSGPPGRVARAITAAGLAGDGLGRWTALDGTTVPMELRLLARTWERAS